MLKNQIKKNLWFTLVCFATQFEILQSSKAQDLVIVQPNSSKGTPKVSFALTGQEMNNSFVGLVKKIKENHAINKVKKQLKNVITPAEMTVFENISQQELIEQLSEIIPLPQALQISSKELYRKLIATDLEGMERILNDTAMMAGKVSIETFKLFFNVVCLNEEVLNAYTNWLHARLIPTVVQILNDRMLRIRNNMIQEQSQHVLSFQSIKEEFQNLALQKEAVERRALQTETVAMGIVPMVVCAQSRLIQSPAIRLISYAALTGLTIEFLLLYDRIVQNAQKEKQRFISFEQQTAKSVQSVQGLKIPKTWVVDEVIGRLVSSFFNAIHNYINLENNRFCKGSKVEREREQKIEKFVTSELKAEQDLASSLQIGQTSQLVQGLLRVAGALRNVKDFAKSWSSC